MIVVIADDITGAAEMGGIALRYGLNTMICDDVNDNAGAEVLVVYTNTRSLNAKEAAQIMGELTVKAMRLQPSLFYKKTDSVLRGHILSEMKSQMKAMNVTKGLLVPINPSSGRVIRNGKYYINDIPVNETSFSSDPEFPISSSKVEDMLGAGKNEVNVIGKNHGEFINGIAVGEAETNVDLKQWAKYNDGSVLLAGGGSFFNAILSSMYQEKESISKEDYALSYPLFFVSGTTFQKNVDRVRNHSELVSYMPSDIFTGLDIDEDLYDDWVSNAFQILQRKSKVIIAIDNKQDRKGDPQLIAEKTAELVKRVMDSADIREMIIEGGATAYSIIRRLGWHRFIPKEEIGQGIVRMEVLSKEGLYLTIKPGSYEWPSQWKFN